MSNARISFRFLLPLLLVVPLFACSDHDDPTGPDDDSDSGESSHNGGRGCLGCHSGFTAAGTVYAADGSTPVPGAIVRLTTGAAGGGTVVLSVETDRSGNFHTSRSIAWGTGLHADVAKSATAPLHAMASTLTNGNCNGCHDSGLRIRVE
jgi:hypothetical protein